MRENAYQICGKDEILSIFSEIVRDKDVRIDSRIKAGIALAKWHGMEEPAAMPKPEEPFPLQEMLPESQGEAIAFSARDLSKLSDEELDRLYLSTLSK